MTIPPLRNLLLYFCLILSISCNDDDDATPERIITFTAHDNYNSYWVLLSDDAGKTVAWKEIPNDLKQEFKYSLKEDITVTVISRATNGSSYYLLKTFTHVENGDYSLGYADFPTAPAIVGSFLLNIPNTFSNSYPQSESNCGTSFNNDNTQMTLSMCENSSNLYLAMYENDQDTPHYYYDPEIHPGESLTVDNNFYSQAPLMKSKIITLDKPANATTIVEGNTVQKKQGFLASINFTPFAKTSIPIYYPDLVGTLFSDFDFGLYYSIEKNVYNWSTKTSKEPADSYPPLDVNFNFSDSTKVTTETLSFPVMGQAQYIFTAFNYYENNSSAWWYVYTEFSNDVSVQLPSFPEDLKKVVDLSFIGKLKRSEVSFVENNSTNGYAGFYKKQLSVNRLPTPFDQREKIYKFNYGTSIMSGGRLTAKGGNTPFVMD